MKKKPIIGIAAFHIQSLDKTYYANREQDLDAVIKAGGCPLQLPPLLQPDDLNLVIDQLDGLYLAGGDDVDGSFFGQDGHPSIKGNSIQRDEAELVLARLTRQRELPTLGICRGCQVINIAAGGDLVIDIPSVYPAALNHRDQTGHAVASHTVELVQGTKLAGVYHAAELTINSFHHQSVSTLGGGLVISALSPDGIIEGIEAIEHPFYLGVQWHPERAQGNQTGIEQIFTAFVQAAQKYHFLTRSKS